MEKFENEKSNKKKTLSEVYVYLFMFILMFSTLPVVYLTVQLTALTHRCTCSGDSRR